MSGSFGQMSNETIAAIDAGDAQHRDEGGQSKWQGKQAQDQPAPRKACFGIKCTRNRDREQHR